MTFRAVLVACDWLTIPSEPCDRRQNLEGILDSDRHSFLQVPSMAVSLHIIPRQNVLRDTGVRSADDEAESGAAGRRLRLPSASSNRLGAG